MKFSQWLEDETLGELVGVLDDNGRALLERVFNAGRELAISEEDRQLELLRNRLEKIVDIVTRTELWCTQELHTHILQAALGKDGTE